MIVIYTCVSVCLSPSVTDVFPVRMAAEHRFVPAGDVGIGFVGGRRSRRVHHDEWPKIAGEHQEGGGGGRRASGYGCSGRRA